MSHNLLVRRPLSRYYNPKVAGAITLILVFLCGAVVGALAMNLGVHARLHRAPFWSDSGKAIYLERVKRELDLTPSQAELMESILDDFTQYYRNVLADGKSRIIQILNEDQRRKFELMLQEGQRQ
jgi:hypothetical protein